ncbi:DNA/RNA nuclease SfsA [Thalassotalea sp. LPB0316]|uniref:DNA/RNA nuclease SfsA n=1 Tax=Thalassotalea sp. LPB0316 TaxID=2769490 RepID=UPI001868AF51|nr:DNA/RNA nuclease SfsA [Thalassotalea sp. LPB0316]QOL26703.1 DNA/RNA nuclease SfsA [Thalassotalea sp. LPB0316]
MTTSLSLQQATLIQRYKRFLADVTLADNTTTTIHVANTGAMTGCAEKGDRIWYSTSSNKQRKYPFSWEFTEKANGDLICVNTHKANDFVDEALKTGQIQEFSEFEAIEREVKYGEEKSKIDFLITNKRGQKTYIEVKSVTLLEDDQGYFPDAKTTRGQKHLRELIAMVEAGHQACLLFFVMHNGIKNVKPACHIDPIYGQLIKQASQAGVQIIAYKAHFAESNAAISIEQVAPVTVLI